jgi:SsrA-binding protein
MSSKKSTISAKVFSRNKRAYYDYEVLDTVEGGLVLTGAEVKSIKTGQASIKESFINIEEGDAWLWNAHVPRWQHSGTADYDPTRRRKVLLHRQEIDKLAVKAREKGVTLIPLKLYGVRGRIKVEIGICRGRKKFEKQRREKERFLKQELHKEQRKYMV